MQNGAENAESELKEAPRETNGGDIGNPWYAYKHVNGTITPKRYFHYLDIKEARESDFVETVVGPFLAVDRDDAMQKARIEISKILEHKLNEEFLNGKQA